MRFLLLSILIFSFIFSGITSRAADSTKVTHAKLPIATFKVNPFTLLDFTKFSLSAGSDIYLPKNIGLEINAGWFFASGLPHYNKETLNGARVRLGIKYNFDVKSETILPFLGLEGKYNYVVKTNFMQVCRYGCQYSEIMLLPKTYNTAGLAVKAGAQLFLGASKNFVFEFYGGLGFKRSIIKNDLPADTELLNSRNTIITTLFNRPAGQYWLPDALLGIQMGYAFRKKQKTAQF